MPDPTRPVPPAKTLTPRKLDALIETLYVKHGTRVQIGMLDIPQVFTEARNAYEAEPTEAAVEVAVMRAIQRLRRN